MNTSKKIQLLHILIALNFFFTYCLPQHTGSFCGKVKIQSPFLSLNSTVSPLNSMIICRSEMLYFKTSVGYFPISSINYTSKILIVSHPSCSSSDTYISSSLLSAGFPSPPQPNLLLLFNCSANTHPVPSYIHNCIDLGACGASPNIQGNVPNKPYSCLLVRDYKMLHMGFHPKDLNCSHYRQVHRRYLGDNDHEEVELGTRISFDIPDHVPDICSECKKPNGNCGVGLRCICHAKECKDQVVSTGESQKPLSNMLFLLLISIVVLGFSFQLY